MNIELHAAGRLGGHRLAEKKFKVPNRRVDDSGQDGAEVVVTIEAEPAESTEAGTHDKA